jgi:hypothetical protein
MKLKSFLTITSMAVCSLVSAIPARASFVGDNVSVNYKWPNLGAILYSGGSSAIPAGGTVFNMSSGGVLANVTASNIFLSFPGGWAFNTVSPKTFDGVVVSDPSAVITAVSIASTNIAGFVASDLSFDSNNVYINFPFPGFSSLSAGSFVSVNVQFASTAPEPATLYLTIGLLAALLVWHRLRVAA